MDTKLFILACVLSCVALLAIILYYGVKLAEIKRARDKARFSSKKAEFIADLYKLEMKWSKKGEFIFAKALSLVIRGFNLPDNPEPQTFHGRSLMEALENAQENDNDE